MWVGVSVHRWGYASHFYGSRSSKESWKFDEPMIFRATFWISYWTEWRFETTRLLGYLGISANNEIMIDKLYK